MEHSLISFGMEKEIFDLSMPHNLLKKSFDKYFTAPVETWIEFVKHCEVVTFKGEEVIKESNTREKYFYFILKGSGGVFLWGKNNFVCVDFAFENSFYGDYMSLLTGQPTPLQTRALENSEMLRITKEEFDKLSLHPVAELIKRVAAEASFVEKQQQQIDLLTKTAKQRYQTLIEKFPEIIKRTKQKHIASYLGITPQSLSRIRKTIM